MSPKSIFTFILLSLALYPSYANSPEWKTISSEHSIIYYHNDSEKIAQRISDDINQEWPEISDLLGYPPVSKSILVISPNESDKNKADMLMNTLRRDGEINPYMFEVMANTEYSVLKQELISDYSKVLLQEMFYGNGIKDAFKGKLKRLPEWFVYGAAEFVAEQEFNTTLKFTTKPDKLKGEEAAILGQSFWHFISKNYGNNNISNLLNYARIIRKEEKAIEITLGQPYEQVMNEWQAFNK